MHDLNNFPGPFEARPCGPRTYRPLRQRARVRFAGDTKSPSPRRTSEGEMDAEAATEEQRPRTTPGELLGRSTLCLPHFGKGSILHGGDAGFTDVLRQYFPLAESNATERLVDLKSRLRSASTHDFWGVLMEEMCDIIGSQCAFVAKRILVDDQDSAVEMPELGEAGSCLMAVALYLNNGADVNELHRDYRYHAFGTPCAHMRHDKVFIIPERMNDIIPNNPNPMPWKQSEAFIGVPLFAEGKCFAHFGMIWSDEGASRRKLGWAFIEMFLHSLEDMILQRILEGRGFAKEVAAPDSTPAKLIPLSAITASQSLKPYARSLSHELRTPMQGVVGMLDIMYSTVLDAIANQQNERVRHIFKDLKDHIEIVQDSSRRAVEAADNVVHAYDLNMQMPETPLTPKDIDMKRRLSMSLSSYSHPQSSSENADPLLSPMSKKRERAEEYDFHPGPPLKRMFTMVEDETLRTCLPEEATTSKGDSTLSVTETSPSVKAPSEANSDDGDQKYSPGITPGTTGPTHRTIVTRDFIRGLVHGALRNGHPTSETHKETSLGEIIEIKTVDSRGNVQDRTIYLEIESDVPEVIMTKEQYLQFALQKLVDNAIKFTEHGSITITVKIGRSPQVVEIWVVDTGCGIAEESKSSLFKPHFQEDASISRSRDGLGLSLFNAKAHVRKKLGGDVTLERSDTKGPSKGSEFLIRLPISVFDTSNPTTPLVGTPPPSSLQPHRDSPVAELLLASTSISLKTAPTSSDMSSVPRSPRSTSRKRAAFNPHLADEYPLNILIAEDNATNRNVAIGSLKKLGYNSQKITVAFDGLEAVKRYETALSKPPAQRFNAVLMDIWMPNMDGYEATARILNIAKAHNETTKIIAVTADITSDSVERAKAAGMQGFLAKPYKVLDIEHIIVNNFPKCC